MNDNNGSDPTILPSEPDDPGRDESISARVPRMVAVASDQDVTDLEPLYSVVDADALELLYRSQLSAESGPDIEVTFSYEGYRIQIDSDKQVNLLGETE